MLPRHPGALSSNRSAEHVCIFVCYVALLNVGSLNTNCQIRSKKKDCTESDPQFIHSGVFPLFKKNQTNKKKGMENNVGDH